MMVPFGSSASRTKRRALVVRRVPWCRVERLLHSEPRQLSVRVVQQRSLRAARDADGVRGVRCRALRSERRGDGVRAVRRRVARRRTGQHDMRDMRSRNVPLDERVDGLDGDLELHGVVRFLLFSSSFLVSSFSSFLTFSVVCLSFLPSFCCCC